MRPDPAGSRPLAARKHRRPGWRFLGGIAALAGMAALAGCAGGGSSGAPVAGTITIAAAPGVDDAPLWLAQKGIFAAAGLHVQIHQYGTYAQEIQAVEQGQAQIAAADYGNILYEQSLPNVKGLQILADAYDAGSGTAEILVGPHYANTITSPADLKNGLIGLPSDGCIPFVGVGASQGNCVQQNGRPVSLLAAAAASLASAYLIGGADRLQWQPMSQQEEVVELGTGALHAALLTEPYVYQAESTLGATSIMDVFSGATSTLPVTGYVATASWVSGHASAVSDFQTAIARAQAQAAMVGTVQRQLTNLPGGEFSATTAEMVSVGTYPTATSPDALVRVETLLSDEGILTKHPASIQDMLVKG